MSPSVNKRALSVVQRMVEKAEVLGVVVEKASNGSAIIDAGIDARGGFHAGRYMTEICMGGLGKASLATMDVGGVHLPSIFVATDHPAISLLGSQFAGWSISLGEYFAMGSGPARAIAQKPKELYSEISYQDTSDVAILVLEGSKKPSVDVLEYLARECGVTPANLHIVIASTSSIAGSTQIAGRVVETGLHRLHTLGLDPRKVLYGCGQAPIPSVHPKSGRAMGRTNDVILYGGVTFFVVDNEEDERLASIVEKTPSSSSSSYGRPFYEIFKEAGFDFYKVDSSIFAPACVTINNLKTGSTFTAGKINPEIVKKSIGL